MRRFMVECGNCRARHGVALGGGTVATVCPHCRSEIKVDTFPALLRGPAVGRTAEPVALDDDSGCFYHPASRAVKACSGCGRFLCSLCEVEWGGATLCPACIEKRMTPAEPGQQLNRFTYHDSIALSLAVVPMLIFYLTIITAPMALFYAVWHWNRRMSVAPRGKGRLVAAMTIAGLQIAGWVTLVVFLVGR